jgi:hypothetical protein
MILLTLDHRQEVGICVLYRRGAETRR